MSNKFKQDQRVYFRLGEGKPEGWAKVDGVQGFIVILELEKPLPSYDYSHIYVVDSQIGEPPKKVVEGEDHFYGDGTIGKQ